MKFNKKNATNVYEKESTLHAFEKYSYAVWTL